MLCSVKVDSGKGGMQVAKTEKCNFASKIHVFRAAKRMSQQELADLVGVSRQMIIQLERLEVLS